MLSTSASLRPGTRHVAITLAVVALHAGLIWALHRVSSERVSSVLMPVSLPAPAQKPLTVTSMATAQRPKAPAGTQPAFKAAGAPQPQRPSRARSSEPAGVLPAEVAPGELAVLPAVPATAAAAADATTTTAATALPVVAAQLEANGPALEWPNGDASHLRNPKPEYPALSKRLNEHGTAIHSVLIAADGRPMSAKLVQSSGYERLDKAAYEAVMRWRYVPGKRRGVPEAMAFNVPIKWVLE